MSDTQDKLTPEQAAALQMLFDSHADGDPLRIEAAIRNLELLADLQGLYRRSAA